MFAQLMGPSHTNVWNANTNDCGVGARRCNSQCAHVFLLFYNRCFADMSALVHEQVRPEPAAEEPATEEPATEEPAAEEPAAEEPALGKGILSLETGTGGALGVPVLFTFNGNT